MIARTAIYLRTAFPFFVACYPIMLAACWSVGWLANFLAFVVAASNAHIQGGISCRDYDKGLDKNA